MNANKLIQIIKDFMACKKVKTGNAVTFDQKRVELITVDIDKNEDVLRIQEIRYLISKIILLGKKRGRPAKKDQEFEDAA